MAEGKFDQVKGDVKKKAGEVVDDQNLKDKGDADKGEGKAKETVEKAKDKATDAIDKVKDKFSK